MLNKFFTFTQNRFEFLYKNSIFLQNIDLLIFTSILAVFVSSLFANSNFIGFFAILASLLTLLNFLIKKDEKVECNKFELFLLAYFMFVIISLFGSTLFGLSFIGFIKIVIYLGFYLSVVQYLKKHTEKIWWILFVIAGCAAYEVFQGLIQTIVRPEAISTWQDISYINPEEMINRIYGTLKPLNPNLFGGYLVAVIPVLFAVTTYLSLKKQHILALISGIFSILSFYILFQTGCRGAYLGLFGIILSIILIFTKLFKNEKHKKIFLTTVSGLSSIGFLLLMSISSIRMRILSIFMMRQDSSNSFRFNVYNSCIDMFKDNWLLGIGLGNKNFREIYGLYMKTGFDALSAYNIYLETAVESGIFALISFLGFLILVLKDAYKFIITKCEDKPAVFAVIFAFASIVGLMVHGFVDTVFFRPQIHFIFWTMVAVIRVLTTSKEHLV